MSGYQRSPYMTDEEWVDYPPYGGNSNTSAFQAPHQQTNDPSRRRHNPYVFGKRLYPDEPSYEDSNNTHYPTPESSAASEERHYSTSTSSVSPKSVRFTVGEDDSNTYNTSPPHARSTKRDAAKRRQGSRGGRNSITNIAREAYRRASQAAEAVTDNLGWLARLWAWVVENYGPGFLAFCLAVFGFVFAARHALDFPESGAAVFFWTARESGRDVADDWNQGKRAQALKQHVRNFNLTRHFGHGGVGGGVLTSFETGPWRVYGDLLRDATGTGMETWFDEARDVDDVVSALWAGLPPLEGIVVASAEGGGNEQQPQPITVTVTFPGGRKPRPGGWKEKAKETNNSTEKTGAGDTNNTTEKTTGNNNTTENTGGDNGNKGQDENAKAVTQRLKMRSSIDMRSTMRKRAEAYFENFLAGRAAIIGRALDDARRFGELVETHLVAPVDDNNGGDDKPASGFKTVGPEFHADVAAKFRLGSDKKGVMSWKKDKFPEVTVRNRTSYILSYAGLHLTTRLLETHQSLYAAARPEPEDLPADLKGQASSLLATSKPDTFSVLTDLRRAEEAERKFLTDLIAQSAYGPDLASKKQLPLKQLPLGWTKQPATLALEKLLDKAAKLEQQLQSAGRNLAWLNERLGAQVAAETGTEFRPENSTAGGASGAPTKVKDEDRRHLFYGDWVWSQTAGELVESWGRGCEGVADAVRESREYARELGLKKVMRGDGEEKGGAVRRWRVDHCEGVSCYGDMVASKPAAAGGDKKKGKLNAWKGWFWNKKAIAGEEESAEEAKEVKGKTQTEEQKPLSGAGDDGDKVTTMCGDDATLAQKAACEKICCGYSMHNEWADILMYGDKDFTYQDLYNGQPEEALRSIRA
ncbi:hypothetical protein PG996_003321 [Apiospora saccharicola]|uniref:Uncharacterized protein n=1 Tax=Apiospora saccharicola TaxID=335842 RepID=A0ABR1W3J7_9PEZI